MLEKLSQGGGYLLEVPIVLAFGVKVVPEIREVLC
jgi:hypothetical protein